MLMRSTKTQEEWNGAGTFGLLVTLRHKRCEKGRRRIARIELAHRAAPEAISSDAKILAFGWRGYMRPPSKERTGLLVWWNDHGYRNLTLRSSGTPRCVRRNASIRQPRDPFCLSRSSGRRWY